MEATTLHAPKPSLKLTSSPTKMIGHGINFERTRRITGYLVGTLDRWGNAKRAEERDRIKHATEE